MGRTRLRRRLCRSPGRPCWAPLPSCLPLLLLLLVLEAQALSQPYIPEHPGQCRNPDQEYYDQTALRCCNFCPPGFRVRQHCSKNINTQCEACEENTYTQSSNSAERCSGCSSECRKGLVEIQECTRTQDRHCWCPPHEFCVTMVFKTCYRCQAYQQCPKGYGVSKPGTSNSDVECAPCEPGTFSDVESHNATCRPHRVCESGLLPGNSTNDVVCKDSRGGVPVTSPPPTPQGKEPPSTRLSESTTPRVDNSLQQKPSTDTAYIIGGITVSLVLMVVFIGAFSCIISRRKALPCKQLLAGKKQFPSPENGADQWPRVSSAAGQEEENLLKISPSSSSSLDYPSVSDKSSAVSDLEDAKKEAETNPERPSPMNSCVYHNRAPSKQPGTVGTHVNISCVVNVCSPDHSSRLLSLNSLADSEAVVGEDVPLSKEESPIQRPSGGQTAVEVEEDHMDTLAYEEGKPLPLSVQDVGMKTR